MAVAPSKTARPKLPIRAHSPSRASRNGTMAALTGRSEDVCVSGDARSRYAASPAIEPRISHGVPSLAAISTESPAVSPVRERA